MTVRSYRKRKPAAITCDIVECRLDRGIDLIIIIVNVFIITTIIIIINFVIFDLEHLQRHFAGYPCGHVRTRRPYTLCAITNRSGDGDR